jgi:hypothetical protein
MNVVKLRLPANKTRRGFAHSRLGRFLNAIAKHIRPMDGVEQIHVDASADATVSQPAVTAAPQLAKVFSIVERAKESQFERESRREWNRQRQRLQASLQLQKTVQ